LDSLPRLAELLRPGGWLLVSGILLEDEAVVTTAAAAQGLALQKRAEKGKWLCLEFRR